jgi:hypothetical protein
MNNKQRVHIVMLLHKASISEFDEVLYSEIQNFGLDEDEIHKGMSEVKDFFSNGIKNLNQKQLTNIIALVKDNKFQKDLIINRLIFFGIEKRFHDNIIQFLKDYIESYKAINVKDITYDFRGVQVATTDNFYETLARGWTGDWELDLKRLNPRRIQIASMNEEGRFPRGYCINADITETELVEGVGNKRYKVYFTNAEIVDTGNRNVKFNQKPVRYIK